jgi:hypothetical protein
MTYPRYDDFVPDLNTAAFQRPTMTAIEDVFMRHQHHGRVVVGTDGGFISGYSGSDAGKRSKFSQRAVSTCE